MIRPFVAAALLSTLLVLAPAAQARIGHTRLAPLPTVLPPPASNRPMRWASVSPGERAHLSASAFAHRRAVVGLAAGVAPRAFARARGLRVTRVLERLRAIQVAASPAALAALAARPDPRVRYVEPVGRLEPAHRRDDPLTWQLDPATARPYEWAFHQVGVDSALNLTGGDSRILVGVVDSGITPVADLRGKVAETFWDEDRNVSAADTVGHGTFVSSIVAARNDDGAGLGGFCGACRVAVFKAIPLDDVQLALGIERLTDAHVRIINLSVVTKTVSQSVVDAISYAQRKGVLIVAASGNEGLATVDFPASSLQPANGEAAPGLTVGSVNARGARSPFSNWGSQLSLVAPGSLDGRCRVGIVGALPPVASDFERSGACQGALSEFGGSRYAYASGTSFAAPEVSGIAALVWSVKPELTALGVATVLEQTARRPRGTDWTPSLGWGVVDARAAVELVAGRPSTDAIRLSGLRVLGRRTPGGTLTARLRATWADGLPVTGGATPGCRITVAGRKTVGEATLTAGVYSCTFTLGPGSAGAAVKGTLTIAAPEAPVSTSSFELTVTGPAG